MASIRGKFENHVRPTPTMMVCAAIATTTAYLHTGSLTDFVVVPFVVGLGVAFLVLVLYNISRAIDKSGLKEEWRHVCSALFFMLAVSAVALMLFRYRDGTARHEFFAALTVWVIFMTWQQNRAPHRRRAESTRHDSVGVPRQASMDSPRRVLPPEAATPGTMPRPHFQPAPPPPPVTLQGTALTEK